METASSPRHRAASCLRLVALVAIAVVVVRTGTSPRQIVPVASETTGAEHAEVHRLDADGAEQAIEARIIRRARQPIADVALFMGALVALLLLAASDPATRRRDDTTPMPGRRCAGAVAGRGPPQMVTT